MQDVFIPHRPIIKSFLAIIFLLILVYFLISEASQKVEVHDIKHIAENKKLVGDMMKEIVDEWDAQKDMFYKQTGISQRNEVAVVDDFDELEHLLNE